MEAYKQNITVDFSYEVLFSKNIFDKENNKLCELIPAKSKVILFIDDGILKKNGSLKDNIVQWFKYNSAITLLAEPFILPGGEQMKNDEEMFWEVVTFIHNIGVCRHSFVLILGGGAVLDMVGFAASIVHRGIRQIRIPSTVLSQNDSGMGVKNGINFCGIKNLLGTFTPPHSVLVDFELLRTLDKRDWLSGISEAFKVAIIKDKVFLDWLILHALELSKRNEKVMEELVKRTAILHLDHIANSGDPFETGSSRPLDFGHWSAHHLEEITHHKFTHGEAVSIGICLDLKIAELLGLIEKENGEKIIHALRLIGLPVWDDALEKRIGNTLCLFEALEKFRIHLGGELTLVMPDGFGKKTEIHCLEDALLEKALDSLKNMVARIC